MTALDEQVFDRLPPHSIELEQCALGTAMLRPDAAVAITEGLEADDFYRPAHQAIFAAVSALLDRSEPVNPVTVLAETKNQLPNKAAPLDGLYVYGLIKDSPFVASVDYCIDKLTKLATLRRVEAVCSNIATTVRGAGPDDADYVVETANKMLDEASRTATKGTAAPVSELIIPFLDALEAGEDLRGVTTGWVDIDRVLSRMRPGQLIVVGARPGMGKTNVMLSMAHHVGVTLGEPAWFGTLEMSQDECLARLLAKDAKVDLRKIINRDELTNQELENIRRSTDRLLAADTLIIDDEPGMGVAHIRSALRSKRRFGRPFSFAAVDYLQLMRSAGRVENRQVEVSDFSRSLKLLAKEYELPLAVGSQLNREVEHRADKRPTMADLRESGSIEQDADVVVLLYRDDHYDPESPHAGEIELNIDKNRQGPKARVNLAFQGHYCRVVDMTPAPWSPTGGLQ